MRIGILGGGLSGLLLAHKLAGHGVEVLEAEAGPGGLCQSFTVDGFTGDYGGHILFSKDKTALACLLRFLDENMLTVRRENRVVYKDRLVRYPFENDLAALPLGDRLECLFHFLFDLAKTPYNLSDWCYSTFGRGISEKYLLPYNRKIWKMDPRDLTMEWVSRVPRPPVADVIRSAVGIPTEGYTHQLFFNYPKSGGIGALIRAMAVGVKVSQFRVIGLSKKGSGWVVHGSGEDREYDRVVSTIPLPTLIGCLPAPRRVCSAAAGLRYNALSVVMVCLKREPAEPLTALYVPDPDVVFHRVCLMQSFSAHNCPAGCSSYLAEITHAPDDLMSDDQLTDGTLRGLRRLGLVDKADVCNVVVRRQPYGYVVNDLWYTSHMVKLDSYLDSIGIYRCGRFSEFKYYNMDDCARSATRVAAKVGSSE